MTAHTVNDAAGGYGMPKVTASATLTHARPVVHDLAVAGLRREVSDLRRDVSDLSRLLASLAERMRALAEHAGPAAPSLTDPRRRLIPPASPFQHQASSGRRRWCRS